MSMSTEALQRLIRRTERLAREHREALTALENAYEERYGYPNAGKEKPDWFIDAFSIGISSGLTVAMMDEREGKV